MYLIKNLDNGRNLVLPVTSAREGNGTPLQYSCLENPVDGGAGRLQSMGSLRVGHDLATSLSLFTFMHWRRKWQPTPVFLPGESQGWQRSLWAAISGVAQSRTQLKRLSSSSSSSSQGMNPQPLTWKCRVLTTGSPGKSWLTDILMVIFWSLFVSSCLAETQEEMKRWYLVFLTLLPSVRRDRVTAPVHINSIPLSFKVTYSSSYSSIVFF